MSAGFDAVRDAFAENFSRRHELGGACCVYHRGEKVVDLWGGVRNKSTGELWQEGTMVLVYSTTKGLAAMALAVAHSRGWLGAAFLGAYLLEHRFFPGSDLSLRIEQGYEIRRPSLVMLRARMVGHSREVNVGGQVIPTVQGHLL